MAKASRDKKDKITKQDKIKINKFAIEAYIGILDWEQKNTQTLIIDLTLYPKKQFNQIEQNLDKTIDYTKVIEVLTIFVESKRHYLLETMIDELANLILQTFSLKGLKLKLTKPMALSSAIASVEIFRSAND